MATILIVEDSRAETEMIAYLLGQKGHETLCSGNGADAIKIAQESQPNLILMDVVMPGIDGFRATRLLRQNPATRHIPVIITSGRDQENFRQWGFRQGACDYIVKPIKVQTLISKIDLHLGAPVHVATTA